MKNSLTQRLGIGCPIIQGPFGGGFSTVELTSIVSNLGGLGSFGAHNLNAAQIVAKTREIKAATDKPFALNLWVSSEDSSLKELTPTTYTQVAAAYYRQFKRLDLAAPLFPEQFGETFENQIEGLLDARPAVFSFVFGIPNSTVLEDCRKKGIVTIGAATTLDEALEVERAGVDCVVLSGFEAGGHRPSFLRPAEDSLVGLGALLSQARGRLQIPVIAAGGITDAVSMQAARILGAQGFQIGTAFLACQESGASTIHKETLFSPRARYTTLSRHYTGRLARFIENEFIAEARTQGLPFLPYPAQNYLLSALKRVAAEKGLHELAPLYSGQGAPNLTHRRAQDLMIALRDEWEKSRPLA